MDCKDQTGMFACCLFHSIIILHSHKKVMAAL